MRVFWWSPRRSIRLLWPEVRDSGRAWARLRMRGGRLAYNFGDELTPHLMGAILGEAPRWSPPHDAELIAVGSVIDLYAFHGAGAAVWGSGLRHEPHGPRHAAAVRATLGEIVAVRGPLTAAALDLSSDTTLGDPGVLAPMLLHDEPRRETGRPVVIPHYRVWNSGEGRRALSRLSQAGLDVVAPNTEVHTVLRRIRDSSAVFASSLHGIIVADAFGVPATLVSFDGGGLSGESAFKYQDYFQSVGGTPRWLQWRDLLDDRTRLIDRARDETAQRHASSQDLAAGLLGAIQGFIHEGGGRTWA